jgi:hypothetical protein
MALLNIFFLLISHSTITSTGIEFRLKMVAPGFNPNEYLQLEALTSCNISVQTISTNCFPCIFTFIYHQADSGKDKLFISFHYTAFATG